MSGNLPHAILIISQDKITNELYAKTIAQTFFCNSNSNCDKCEGCVKTIKETNPDFLIYPKNKSLTVDDAKEIYDSANRKPMMFENKLYFLSSIDEATTSAQNKLLKILEEPPAHALFILTATNEDKILPTIVSRVSKFFLFAPNKNIAKQFLCEKYNAKDDQSLEKALSLSENYIGKALEIYQSKEFEVASNLATDVVKNLRSSKQVIQFSSRLQKNNNSFLYFLSSLNSEYRKLLLSSNQEEYSKECLTKILELLNEKLAEQSSNVNQNLIIDNLLMQILELKYLYRGEYNA